VHDFDYVMYSLVSLSSSATCFPYTTLFRSLLDMVPNHMGIMSECNGWWMDLLENGPSSPYASTFDIDWRPVKCVRQNRVLLPIPEDQYGVVLQEGKLRGGREGGALFVTSYAARTPPTPDS